MKTEVIRRMYSLTKNQKSFFLSVFARNIVYINSLQQRIDKAMECRQVIQPCRQTLIFSLEYLWKFIHGWNPPCKNPAARIAVSHAGMSWYFLFPSGGRTITAGLKHELARRPSSGGIQKSDARLQCHVQQISCLISAGPQDSQRAIETRTSTPCHSEDARCIAAEKIR